ncbi:MAG: HPr family phosphocarrier protein [Candidatus Izemoplasma sp.]
MKKDIIFTQVQGLHARSATLIVSKANKFKSDIFLSYDNVTVDLKSIMGVLSLGVKAGSLVTLDINGEDEEEATKAMVTIFNELNLK